MNDPERLLRGSEGALATRLVRAGVDEAPSRQSVRRTLSAVAAATTTFGAAGTAGALGGATAAKTATTLGLVGLAKWAGIGMASGALVSLAAHGLARHATARPAGKSLAVTDVVTAAKPSAAESPTPRFVPLPVASDGARIISAPHAASVSAPASTTQSDDLPAPLAAEVAFVDRARGLFLGGSPSAALAALASYEHDFTEPRLLPEVLRLRMDSLAAMGQRGRAEELARVLVRDFGRSPHAARARAVLSGK